MAQHEVQSVRLVERFRAAVASIPSPGGGGCHVALLGVASRGVSAGLLDYEIFSAIRAGIPCGSRRVTDAEIHAAIKRARATVTSAGQAAYTSQARRPTEPAIDYVRARANLIAKGGGAVDPDGADLWESSPIRLGWANGLADTIAFLETAYDPTEFVYIGTNYGSSCNSVRCVADWLTFFRLKLAELNKMTDDQRRQAEVNLAEAFPHFVANPLTGKAGLTKDGKPSYRADSCVAAFRWIVAEFDTIGKPEQLAFFKGLGLPCSALIDTGGKSIHALLRVNAQNVAEWEQQVEGRLFNLLSALGLDRACKNESRMSRLPGLRRLKMGATGGPQDTGKFQYLLWLTKNAEMIQ